MNLLGRLSAIVSSPRRGGRAEEIAARIVREPVTLAPIPFLYLPNLITPEECREIIRYWPSPDVMYDEGAGLKRQVFNLIFDDQRMMRYLPSSVASFWNKEIDGKIGGIYRGIAAAFAPWIEAKFGADCPDKIELQIHRLLCMEAEKGFTEHKPHSHSAAPNWSFSFLLYVDDIGRADRGTTLYRPDRIDFDNHLGNIIAGHHPKVHREFDAPFKQGALLAFLDCALSLHGSTPFEGQSSDNSRRIVRSHVSLGPREVKTIFGIDTDPLNSGLVAAVSRFEESGDEAVFKPFRLSNEISILRTIAQRAYPPPRSSQIKFPAL